MTTANVPAPPKHDIGGLISRAIELFKSDIGNWLIISVVGFFALGVGMWGGYHNCVLKAMRGEKPEIGDVLMPFSRFGDFFMPALLQALALTFLTIFCGAGIVLAALMGTWWFYAYPLMIERGMGWKEATEYSKKIVQQDLVGHFIVFFVAGLVGNIGGIIGMQFLTTVLMGMIATFAYRDLFAGPGGGGGGQHLPYQGGAPMQPQGAPAPYGTPAAAPAGWGQPAPQAPAPQAAAPAGWGQPAPQAPAPQAPAPQAAAPAAWDQPAPQAPAPQAAAPQAAWAPPAADEGDEVETATQSTTTNPEEMVHGKTMAMSAMDFEKMLAEQSKNKPQG